MDARRLALRRRRRVGFVLGAALAVSLGLGACGGDDAPESPPAAPGADVDPNADGVIGGSINKAKDVGDDAESRDAQLEQQGGGGGTP
jgi:hypothetical protein